MDYAQLRDDELMAGLPWPVLQGSMHRDAITELPPGAVWLAESAVYPYQAFRIGERAWGLQFHPEVSPTRYRRWAANIAEDAETMARVVAGVSQFETHDSVVRAGAFALAGRFGAMLNDAVGRQTARGRLMPGR